MADEPIDFGSLDDEELEAALQARYDAAKQRLAENTPRCLAAFISTPTHSLDSHAFDGHGSDTSKVYALACRCGSDTLSALGHHTVNRDVEIFVSPLSLKCERCGVEAELFDSAMHGYDAEHGHMQTNVRDQGTRGPFACGCGGTAFRPYARFEYPGDILEDSIGDWAGNEHNLFAWFSLVGECATGCGRIAIADFECA